MTGKPDALTLVQDPRLHIPQRQDRAGVEAVQDAKVIVRQLVDAAAALGEGGVDQVQDRLGQ